MDRQTIFTKTAKGLQEATGKTSALSRELRNILKEVDGKATVGQLGEKIGKMTEPKLLDAFGVMLRDGYVREFVTAQRAGAPPPQGAGGGEDLDFTSLTPTPAPKADQSAARAREEAAAKTRAEARAKAEAVVKARLEAEAREKAEAEAKAKAAAEAKAKAEAEAKAKAAAEAKTRAEAEERARREADQKARREAEERAQREAQERARVEAELTARLEEERRAREEIERKAKEEAQRLAREAEERARRETDELRAQLEAERRAREDAERRAKEETERREREAAERRAKEEAERREHEEAERRAKEETERREREETERRAKEEAEWREREDTERRAKEEAARRDREEAERRAKEEAERREREEADRRAKEETERREREEADRRAKEDAEHRSKEESERREREEADRRAKDETERREREDAERRTKEEAERREREEADRREREDAERRTKEEAERRSKEESDRREREDADRRVKEEAERLEREEVERREEEEAERGAREEAKREEREREPEEAPHTAASTKEESKARAKLEAEEAARARKESRARERELAKERKAAGIEETPRRAEPEPGIELPVGKMPRERNWARIISLGLFVILFVALAAIHVVPLDVLPYEKAAAERLGEKVRIGSIHFSLVPQPHLSFDKVSIGEEPRLQIASFKAVPELSSMFAPRKVFRSIEIEGLALPQAVVRQALWGKGSEDGLQVERVQVKGLKLELKGMTLPPLDVDASFGTGGLEKAILADAEKNLSVSLQGEGGKTKIEITAKRLVLPFAQSISLDDFSGKGTLSARNLLMREFEARAFDGNVAGNARLSWDNGWSFDGELAARGMDAARVAGPALSGGRFDGKGSYGMKADVPEKLMASARLEGSFDVQKGALAMVDLTRMLRGNEGSGGSTLFSELTGSVVADASRVQLRQVRLSAGLLSANGSADVDAHKNLSGRMQIELRAQVTQFRATVAISGTLAAPQFRRSN